MKRWLCHYARVFRYMREDYGLGRAVYTVTIEAFRYHFLHWGR